MKSYFAYIRVSTVRQGEHGSSLQEQRAAIEAYARRTGLTIGSWFEEMETAAKQGRRAFNKMIGELGKERAGGVIIHKIDRSTRNLRDWARLGELIDQGVEVHFVQDNLDLSTRGGRLSADIQAVVAADYVRNLREEVRKGRYGRLKQGFYPLSAPMGYLNCGSAKPKAVDPVRGPLVRQAFELYATGNYSIQLLRHEMARRGLTTGAGAPLAAGHLARTLHNPFYMGLMRIRSTGEVFQGIHQPLVSPAVFERVQGILEGRLYPRVQTHQFLFRRIIKCSQCGRSLTGERQKGRVYYRCHSYRCPRISIREDSIEAVVRSELGLLQLTEGDIGDFREFLREHLEAGVAHAAHKAAILERDLALIDQRLERLTDALLDGSIDRTAYETRRETLLTRRLEVKHQLSEGGESTHLENVAKRFELAFVALQSYENATDQEKRDLLRNLGSNLVACRKKVEFPMQSPFAELREWMIRNECGPHRGAVRTPTRDKRQRMMRRLVDTLARALETQPTRSPKSPKSTDSRLSAI